MRWLLVALLLADLAGARDVSVPRESPPAKKRASKQQKPIWECEGVPPIVRGIRRPLPTPPPTYDPLTDDHLWKQDIIDGMGPISARAACCYRAYRARGLFKVLVEIAPDGNVTAAREDDSHAGTPTARCIEGAVKEAKFPAFSGPPMVITYPFMLR